MANCKVPRIWLQWEENDKKTLLAATADVDDNDDDNSDDDNSDDDNSYDDGEDDDDDANDDEDK